jgi:hypothetical protein
MTNERKKRLDCLCLKTLCLVTFLGFATMVSAQSVGSNDVYNSSGNPASSTAFIDAVPTALNHPGFDLCGESVRYNQRHRISDGWDRGYRCARH